jgi:predicted RNase H-like nuclease (RuvC/YqgF family)
MSIYVDMYKPKKKRPVDPNAPPRPNLMSHDKVIRDQKTTIDQQQQNIQQLMHRVDELERKHINQTAYLNALHQEFNRLTRK